MIDKSYRNQTWGEIVVALVADLGLIALLVLLIRRIDNNSGSSMGFILMAFLALIAVQLLLSARSEKRGRANTRQRTKADRIFDAVKWIIFAAFWVNFVFLVFQQMNDPLYKGDAMYIAVIIAAVGILYRGYLRIRYRYRAVK